MPQPPLWLCVVLTLLIGAEAAPAGVQPAYRHLRIIAPAAPGGGWD